MPSQLQVEALLDPRLYGHPVHGLHLVETHISWVILTGEYAYKIKKPLDLGFLNFSTLERRRHFCEEELRLNRRLAPSIYLEVVEITGTQAETRIGGAGRPIDYAVKMRQFPQEGLLDRMLAEGRLTPERVDRIAQIAAEFHSRIERAPEGSGFGSPAEACRPARENFEQILQRETDGATRERLESLRAWSENSFNGLEETMARRKEEGFIRECHGDMHLGNMAEVGEEILFFDGIEFNDRLRWIDTMSEVAFLFTDFAHRGRPDYAWRFLNGYLTATGDYPGLMLLPYYRLYRTLVRAKVARIRLSQPGLDPTERAVTEAEYRGYLVQAEGYTHGRRPELILMRGVSGCGKSYIARQLSEQLGAIHLRSDVERKRLFSLSAGADSGSTLDGGIYTPEADRLTLKRLVELAGAVLGAELPVIVDATFLRREWRRPFQELAELKELPFTILDIQTDEALLRERLRQREQNLKQKGGREELSVDASEAGLSVAERQLAGCRPLDGDERPFAIRLDGGGEQAIPALIEEIRARSHSVVK